MLISGTHALIKQPNVRLASDMYSHFIFHFELMEMVNLEELSTISLKYFQHGRIPTRTIAYSSQYTFIICSIVSINTTHSMS